MIALSLSGLRCALLHVAFGLASLTLASAEEGTLPFPKNEPILTIEGNIAVTNATGKALFDRAMLEEIGMISVETTTPWFDGPVKFEGVPADRIMEIVGAEGTEVVAVALNDYRSTIPLADFRQHGVILALKRDGEYMRVSERGPLFIVYPYDSDPQLHSQQFYSRSVWQLSRLIVR
jgi:hypothetical protein